MKQFFIFIFTIFLLSHSNASNSKKFNKEVFIVKDTTWKSLTLREKIGQTMIIRGFYDDQIKQFGSMEIMLKKYPVGGIFVPAWDFLSKHPQDKVVEMIKKAIADYQNASKFPLFVTEDFERGVGYTYTDYTNMPSEMGLGATNNPNLAFQFGTSIAKEAKDLGINWLLHPLADLNKNPLQDLIVERAIGDDSNAAFPMLKEQCKGMLEQGIIPTIKHFPGDGVTIKNQHLVTSTNYLSKKEWNKTFGQLYKKLINEGIPTIMVGHIRLPAFQTKKLKGVYPPATLSDELLQGLLKDKLKFKGVIISDALNMGGAAGYYKNELETAIASFEAGVDMILWPNLEYLDLMETRILSGKIPMSRLDDAVSRIWALRERFGLLEKSNQKNYKLTVEDKNQISKTADEVAKNAITLVSEKKNKINKPFTNKKIAIVNIGHVNRTNELKLSQKLLQDQGFIVDTLMHNPTFFEWGQKLEFFENYDYIFVAMENRYFSPLGTSLLKDQEVMGVWTLGMIPQEKIIAVSYSNPYYVNLYFENAFIKINAYSIDSFSQQAVVDALCGKIPFKGKSPVKLDHQILD